MLKDTPIVIIGEATASLDAENETEVQRALYALIANKTVLIIAHRMRTVDGAEKSSFFRAARSPNKARRNSRKTRAAYTQRCLHYKARKHKSNIKRKPT